MTRGDRQPVGISSRSAGHRCRLGAALISLSLSLSAPAAVIYSGLLNTTIPTDYDGTSINIDGGVLNMFFGGFGVANDDVIQPYRDGSDYMDTLLNFATGATIDASTLYLSTGYGGSQDHIGTTFTAGQEGYIGFKTNDTNYGWVRVIFTNNTGGAMILDWAYDEDGEAIVVGGVRQVGQDILLTADFTLSSQLADVGGATNIDKSGDGTTTILTGENTCSGTTTVNSGTLALAAGASLLNTSSLLVKAGATLAGQGTIGGSTTIEGLATHAPGLGAGVQSFNSNLNYLSNSILSFQLTDNTDFVGSRGSLYDGINVSGSLNIASGVTSNLVFNASGSTVDWSNSFWNSNHSWLVYDNANSPTLASGTIFDTINISTDHLGQSFSMTGGSFTWNQVGNDVYLVYTVPEPGIISIFALLGMLTLRLRHRRHDP